ncbi:hypothetical protein [Streptomyces sp. RPT161]|uniref:hypothetical protein n=1 Tax=Streptomyces sp. RPT161 TaxID=3015993 RepID=UPI0022B8A64E|nr:hypothetical protein [Streptomyces sp. RPT161]
MKANQILLGLLPWLLFSFVTQHLGADTVGYAALASCLIGMVLTVRGALVDGFKTIDAAGVLTFAALAAVGLTGGHHTRQLLVDYGRAGSAFALAVIMLISVLTVPFTEQYARSSVDRRHWNSPAFRSVNRRISLLWSGVVFAAGVCHLIAGASGTGNLLLNWVIPLLLGATAVKQTKAIVQESRARGTRTQP